MVVVRLLPISALVFLACSAGGPPSARVEPPGAPPLAVAAPKGAPEVAPPALAPGPRPPGFLKGQTHVHTNRSYDARTPPDQVVEFYRARGYDFLVLTDHNRVTSLPAPDGMLLFAGVELSQNSTVCEPKPSPGYRCLFHLSGLFVDPARDPQKGERIPLAFRPVRLEAYKSELEIVHGLDGVPVLNHPLFHFAADGRMLSALREAGVRHVELWNASLDQQSPTSRKSAEDRAEQLWDEVSTRGSRVFGVATDDAHHFADAAERARVGKFAYVGDRAWIMLRAEKNAASIRAAFQAGDFYSSTGVTLAKLEVERGVLALEVAPAAGERYVVRFVGLGGRELERVSGLSARRALAPGDGYLRAVVEDSQGRKAWTQPLWSNP